MVKKIVMCEPKYFDVVYKINPWMDPTRPTSRSVALDEWNKLKKIYEQLGVQVDVIEPKENLPDLVFAANAFFAIGKKAILARFRHPERQGETEVNKMWLTNSDFDVIDPKKVVYEVKGILFWLAILY